MTAGTAVPRHDAGDIAGAEFFANVGTAPEAGAPGTLIRRPVEFGRLPLRSFRFWAPPRSPVWQGCAPPHLGWRACTIAAVGPADATLLGPDPLDRGSSDVQPHHPVRHDNNSDRCPPASMEVSHPLGAPAPSRRRPAPAARHSAGPGRDAVESRVSSGGCTCPARHLRERGPDDRRSGHRHAGRPDSTQHPHNVCADGADHGGRRSDRRPRTPVTPSTSSSAVPTSPAVVDVNIGLHVAGNQHLPGG